VITLGQRPAHRVAIGSSGTALTVANASAELWDVVTGRAIAELAHGGAIDAAGFSPRGDRVFTGSRDKTGRLWDARDGRLVATLAGHQSWVWRFAFAADGTRVVTASQDGSARIWDAATGGMVHELRGRSGPINAVAFDRTGRRVVTGSQDATATIWDADTGERLGSLGRHGNVIAAVAFSPDGAFVATASMDGTARIWDAARFEQIDAMDVTWPRRTSDTNISWIEFGATADTVLVASRSGALVWATDRDTRDGATIERWIRDHAPYRLSRASLVRAHSD
jgi:WD40 repeat protein